MPSSSIERARRNSAQGARLLSRPIEVHWQGWRTDTLTLQRTGWKLAVEYDPAYDNYTLMLRHESMRMSAITSAVHIPTQRIRSLASRCEDERRGLPMFNVVKIAPTIELVQIRSTDSWDNFNLIDATPRIVEDEVTRLEDLNIFAMAIGKAEQVTINQADMTVVEHLDAIKNLQSDKQKDLREKARKGDSDVRGNIIVQLVDYK